VIRSPGWGNLATSSVPAATRTICLTCAAEFRPATPFQRYCSPDCQQRRRRSRPGRGKNYSVRRCVNCEAMYSPSYPSQRMCSMKCVGSTRARRCERCNEPCPRRGGRPQSLCLTCSNELKAERRLTSRKAIAADVRQRQLLVSVECPWCLTSFTRRHLGQRYCCTDCQRTANHRTKKARRRGAPGRLPSVWEIHRRDNGICQLCHQKVDRRFTVPDRRAATIDHIVPVSKGGTNADGNLQLAHHGCNSRKRDRIEQRSA